MLTSAPARLLAVTTATTVFAFVATLVFSHSRLLPLDERAIAVTENGTPSVEALAMTRGKLVTMLATAHAAVDGSGVTPAEIIHSARKDLHAAIARYEALPRFPGESELAADAALAAGAVEASLKRALETASSGDNDKARRILSLELHPAVQQLDDALATLVAFNTSQVHDSMTAIRGSRQSALQWAWTLGAASVCLAISSAIAALYSLRNHAKVTAERNRLLSERATELESFAGRIAHDLRGPLSAMLLRLNAAERKQLSAEDVVPMVDRIPCACDTNGESRRRSVRVCRRRHSANRRLRCRRSSVPGSKRCRRAAHRSGCIVDDRRCDRRRRALHARRSGQHSVEPPRKRGQVHRRWVCGGATDHASGDLRQGPCPFRGQRQWPRNSARGSATHLRSVRPGRDVETARHGARAGDRQEAGDR